VEATAGQETEYRWRAHVLTKEFALIEIIKA
jgi:hypothetical protein